MRIIEHASRVLSILAAIAIGVSPPLIRPVAAQPPPVCTWNPPLITSGETWMNGGLWSRVQVTCGGGAVGCKGRIVFRQYVWDMDYLVWVERPNTSQSQVITVHCGDSAYGGYTGYRSDWPINAICCLTTQWQVFNGTQYVNSGPANNLYFNNW